MTVDFDSPQLIEWLSVATSDQLDELEFGVVAMDRNGDVVGYNAFESARAGIAADRVMGRNFFESVGPCTNNYLVAQRFHDEPDLDDFLDFVFTVRMKPTPVRLRMLAEVADAGPGRGRSTIPRSHESMNRR